MPYATNASSPVTSSNGTALTFAWWVARSASWRAGSTYEHDQRCLEAGETGAGGESVRRTTGRAAAAGGQCGPPELLSARCGRPADGRPAGLLRLVFLEMGGPPRGTPNCR